MASSKNVFEQHAELLSSLAHPTRLEIVQLLRSQTLNVSQITSMVGRSQANVSQHLTVLRQSGVLVMTKIGKESYYSVSHRNFTRAIDLMRDVLNVGLPETGEPTVIDPICHMELTPKTASHIYMYDGVRHYFCAGGCYRQFVRTHKGDT